MIHAHHFYFADQPALRQEYESFGFETKEESSAKTIRVEEIQNHDGFEYRSVLRYLSGRASYYLSNIPFENMKKDEEWGLEIVDVLTLVWDGKNDKILYAKGENFTPELLQFWIFHTFFPIVLELQETYKMLHVGAVEVAGGPILFAAPSFGGKSTMTDFFIRKGHTLYSDDTLAIRKEDGGYMAYPSFPYHRPYREPETLGYRAENFAGHPAAIKALFELEAVAADAPVEIRIQKGIARFKAFFYSGFIKFSFRKKERFDYFSKMARQVPVYRVAVPWNLDRLEEVYDAIVEESSKQR